MGKKRERNIHPKGDSEESSLAAEGILHDPLDPRNSTQVELDQLRTGQFVDNELEKIKAELAGK